LPDTPKSATFITNLCFVAIEKKFNDKVSLEEFTMPTALITGITGMVGSHLLDFLIENTDWKIYGITRWRSPASNIEHHFNTDYFNSRITYLEADLLDYQSLLNAVTTAKPDYVFHLAAQSFPTTSFNIPIQTLDINILGTARLLEAIKFSGLDPWIHVCSSSEIFGRVKSIDLPIKENTRFQPASPYSISKIGTDLLSVYYSQAYNMKTISTRMFTHTGPRRGEVFAESAFAKQIALIEMGTIKPSINVGNLDSLRTWSDVRDAVRAYYVLLTNKPISGEVYNIGGTFTCTVGEMLDYLLSISTFKEKIQIKQNAKLIRPLDADLQVPDISKFQNHTGWKPEISFEKTMGDLLNYWRQCIQ
jgi:GDPmannose 4,6-dehydratase